MRLYNYFCNMNRNLRYIILMMSVALIGIIIFQAYWISNSFDLHNKMFRNDVNMALERVLNQDVEVSTIGDIMDFRDSTGEPITIEAHRQAGEETKDQYFISREDLRRIIDKVVVSLATIHPELDEIGPRYKAELEGMRITTPFFLAFRKDGAIYSHTGADTSRFDKSQAVQRLPGIAMRKEQVLAFFPENRSYILNRMWLTLFASILLICLTAGSFFYMLVTLVRQRKLSEIKNDFINNMTHELKTPIATVSAAMEALVNFDAINDKSRSLKYIELSRKELSRLSGMVENVLRISTFEKQKLVLFKETFNVCQLLEDTAQQFQVQSPDKVQFNFDLKGPGYIHADKFHIQNVISNLFDNAIKYSQGSAVIDVTCARSAEFIVFSVRDHGMGITREQQQHIFEKFYRVPTGDLHAVKGFGLGLAYVRQILEVHGGTIGVKSQLGAGSEFTIALPEIQ
ncbi:MAG TPA: hypothetical protein DC042_15760 [Bacteroidales bacterium]|nr:hypothetical protein [Bacteroidales bacterium]